MTSPMSPPTDVLRRNRITTADLASACGLTPMDVEAQLSGRRPMERCTLDALRRLAGSQVADELLWTASRARAAFLDQQRSRVAT